MARERVDPERLTRALSGDDTELEAVLRQLEPELRAAVSIQPFWRRSLDVDDILQVSFMEAFLRGRTLTNVTPESFGAWMRKVVRNNLRDAIRGLERDKRPDARRRLTHMAGGESARTLMHALADEHQTVSARVVNEESIEQLMAAIETLPASYRLVVREVDLSERSVADVAEEMGRTRGAVHLLRYRAHARLAELLGGAQ